MAYMGEIDYLVLEFGKVDWQGLRSPWSPGRSSDVSSEKGHASLIGEVRTIKVDDEHNEHLYFDSLEVIDTSAVQCVVLGIEKGSQPLSSKTHYFILVAPKVSLGGDGSKIYERIGAGYLPGKYISSAEQKMRIS
jgi:hypothetical protein